MGNRQIFSELGTEVGSEEEKKIARVLGNETVNLMLNGIAGTANLDNDYPIQDKFTLILKMKKCTKN